MLRREWLKQVGVGGFAVFPTVLWADGEPLISDVVRSVVANENVKPDDRVELLLKADAANGAVVPVGVHSTVPNTQKIILLVTNHPQVKVAELDTSNAMIQPRLSTHLQLTEPATITALIKAPSGWHMSSADVKTLGENC